MDVVSAILSRLEGCDTLSSLTLADALNLDHQTVVGGIKSLQSMGEVISCEQVTETVFELTSEGQDVAKNGSHEFRVYSAVPSCGISQNMLMDKLPNAKIGLSKALAARWLKIVKDPTNGPMIFRAIEHVEDSVSCLLSKFNAKEQILSEAQKTEFKKRKLLAEVKRTSYIIQKGPSFSLNVGKEETDLSSEMIARFSEMPTNNYVECSFWNFDSLFQPQQHPARDAHDTFFISDPATTDLIKTAPAHYIQRVQTVHSQGSFGSRGYQSEWLPSEAEKNLLRTHTTAVSARMLYALAKQVGSYLCAHSMPAFF
ncbi:hypothetical protein AHF37_00854 [Paragonimus kellicotti]|nr:hypothetical protein AHF37_00854 [Paragonimus kellicotti]